MSLQAQQFEAVTPPTDLKRCPRCERWLSRTDDFGVCRARADGLNLYCKVCIREKIQITRAALREYRARNKPTQPALIDQALHLPPNPSDRRIARVLRKLSPSDRVRETIRLGARTYGEIYRKTRLSKDEVCDALANLLLWTREIRTEVIKGVRMYFLIEEAEAQPKPQPASSLKTSFASIEVLMPGKKPVTNRRKAA